MTPTTQDVEQTVTLQQFLLEKTNPEVVSGLNLTPAVQNLSGSVGMFERIWNSLQAIGSTVTVIASRARMIFVLTFLYTTIPLENFRSIMAGFFREHVPQPSSRSSEGVSILDLIMQSLQGQDSKGISAVIQGFQEYYPTGVLAGTIAPAMHNLYVQLLAGLQQWQSMIGIRDYREQIERSSVMLAAVGALLKIPVETLEAFYREVCTVYDQQTIGADVATTGTPRELVSV